MNILSPENRDLFDIEMDFRRLGDAEGLYLCARVRELEEENDALMDSEQETITALEEELEFVKDVTEQIYKYVEESDTVNEEDFKRLDEFIDQIRTYK